MNNGLSYYVQRYFMSYLISQRNYGANTINSYRDTFRLLLIYLDESGYKVAGLKMPDITYDVITSFLEWLVIKRKNTVSTKNVRLAHIRSFYEYVLLNAPEFSSLCTNIISIPFAKEESRPPAYMTEEEVTHLLQEIDSNTKGGLRHLALLSLLYDSGCRVQEIIDLNVSDIQFDRCNRIYVHGKGNKYRNIPLRPETAKILKKYISEYHLSKNDILFINRQKSRMTRQGIRYILRKYESLVQYKYPSESMDSVFPHLMRHSKATHLVNAGVNIYNVRDFLGHSSVATTQIYLTSNPEVTRKAIEQAAQRTVPHSGEFYSETEKAELIEFLNNLH